MSRVCQEARSQIEAGYLAFSRVVHFGHGVEAGHVDCRCAVGKVVVWRALIKF